MLSDLASSETQTTHLTELAYEWSSVVCKNYSSFEEGKDILLLSLEIGFRHLDPEWIDAKLIHTEHHQKLADIIFKSENGDAIADLLHAWTSRSTSHVACTSLNICVEHLIGLYYLYPLSSRLHNLIVHAIQLISYEAIKQVRVEEFVRLLNNLHIGVGDIEDGEMWMKLLLDIIQSDRGIQDLSHPYWELLVELAVSWQWNLEKKIYSPHIMMSLEDAKEWDKLECWIAFIWMSWPSEGDKTADVEDIRRVMLSLFHQRPGAIQWLEQKWRHKLMWTENNLQHIPELFQQICKQGHIEAAEQDIQ